MYSPKRPKPELPRPKAKDPIATIPAIFQQQKKIVALVPYPIGQERNTRMTFYVPKKRSFLRKSKENSDNSFKDNGRNRKLNKPSEYGELGVINQPFEGQRPKEKGKSLLEMLRASNDYQIPINSYFDEEPVQKVPSNLKKARNIRIQNVSYFNNLIYALL